MNNLVLIGMMGSGKSRVGKRIADYLNCDFFDIDKVIEQNEQMRVSDIFAQKGEAFFRKLEFEALKKITQNQGCVIATGGGAVSFEPSFNLLKTQRCFYLEASIPTLLKRTANNEKNSKARPLLADKDSNQRCSILTNLLHQRGRKYQDLALHCKGGGIIDANKNHQNTFDTILNILKHQN